MSDLVIGRREKSKLCVRGPSQYEIGPLRFFKLHKWLGASGSRYDGSGEPLSLKFHEYLREMGTSQTARDVFPWATSGSSWWFIYPLETCRDSVRIKRSKVCKFLRRHWEHVGGAKQPSRFPSARDGNKYWSAHRILEVDEQKKNVLRDLAKEIAKNIKQQRKVGNGKWRNVAKKFKKIWIAQSKKKEQNKGLEKLYNLSRKEIAKVKNEWERMDEVIGTFFEYRDHTLEMKKLLFAYAVLRALYGETEEEVEGGGKRNKKDDAEHAKVIKQWASRALAFHQEVLNGTQLTSDERGTVQEALTRAKEKGKPPWRIERERLNRRHRQSGRSGKLRVLKTFRLCKYVRHCLRIARAIKNGGMRNRGGASS